jgi:penicillin-insensitive murein endopeptidase
LQRLGALAIVGAILLLMAAPATPHATETVAYPLPQPKPHRAVPAKELFGAQAAAASLAPRALGSYARGCLAGAAMLPVDGQGWQAMRLSRNRNWGHPALIAYLERLAADATAADEWPGLLVGDMSQPRGGPMLTGHASHQIGLDADIWLLASPGRTLTPQEREDISSTSVISGRRDVNPDVWTPAHARIIRRAASYPEVARIFVHPAIKKALCEWAPRGDRSWLRVVRPWYGHHYHFHVRLACPQGSEGCRNQAPPPAGDGCGSELDWWLSDAPYKPADAPSEPPRELTLADLPGDCAQVVDAPPAQ